MMKNFFAFILFLGLMFSTSVSAYDEDEFLAEIGATVGTPSGFNLNAGIWGSEHFPLLLRASGMFFGQSLHGIQGELGWIFDRQGSFKQYFAVAALKTKAQQNSLSGVNWTGIGPVYGFNLSGFSLLAGITIGEGNKRTFGVDSSYGNAQLIAQIGYTILF